MPNRWTGSHDVAIELAPAGANALLAAIHRKGHAQPDSTGPHLLHSLALNLPLPGSQATHDLRGHLELQLSTPSVSVAEGAANRVIVALELYGWFRAAFGSAPAPEFLHGELRFTTGVSMVECAGATLAEVRLDGSVTEVSFAPAQGSGLSLTHQALVESVVRDLLAEAFGPAQFRVTSIGNDEFAVGHVAFKALRTSTKAAFLLLVSFGSQSGPTPDPAGASEIFVGGNEGLAIALGRDFIAAKLRDAAREHLSGISVSGSRFRISFQAAPDPSTLRIELRPGALRAVIDGTGSLSPGGSFAFRLRQDFGLVASGGDLLLTLVGDPALDITQGNTFLHIVFALFRGRILDKIEVAASGVVQVASGQLDALVDRAVSEVLEGLGVPGLGLRVQRASIDGDGVILGGALDVGASPPVFPSFTGSVENSPSVSFLDAVKFSAFESWIPGGTIQGYRWMQVRPDGTVTSATDEPHRFVLRLEPLNTTFAELVAWPPSVWCLEVRGTQSRGALGPGFASGTLCGLRVAVPTVDLGALDGRLTLELVDEGGAPTADVDPWSRYRAHAFASSEENRGLLLVHHAGPKLEALQSLREVLKEHGTRLPILPTLVLDELDRAPRELSSFALTRDPEGTWRRRFGIEEAGATALVGAGGKRLWHDAGPLRADALRKALAGIDAASARPPRQRSLALALPAGTIAPHFYFLCQGTIDTGGLLTLSTNKLVGQEFELVFWTSWSRASLEELRRRAGAKEGDVRTLLVNDGEEPELAARFLKQHALAFEHTATDPERKLSRRYGIECWPTVVRIDARGRVAGARFGLAHAHAFEPKSAC